MPNDDFRANTKVEDDDNLLNEGKRFRHLDLGIFLTPDPLEYVDGLNPYIYCSQNPWGRWDPEGLFWGDLGSIALDVVPVIGTGKSIYEFVRAKDAVTGESVSRTATAIGIVASVFHGGKIVTKGVAKASAKVAAKEGAEAAAKQAARQSSRKSVTKSAKETAEQATRESKNATSNVNPMQRGRDSEKRVLEELGMEKNTEKFSTPQGNVIPDAHPNTGLVVEIKDAKNVSNTRQIRGEKELANREGGKLEIHTGDKTKVSKNAQNNATIVRHKDLGPQNNE